MELGGIHYVTAVTSDAPGNVAFYTDALGLRMVKKTVNQDDVSAYHLFYGDEVGNPGAEITFFDWAGIGPQTPGWGMVSSTAFRVPNRESLEWWKSRFDERGIARDGEVSERGGRATLRFTDHEGQRLELVHDEADGVPGGVPWEKSSAPREVGVRGLDSVELSVRSLGPTEAVLTEVMGFRKADESEEEGRKTAVYEVGPGGPGARVRLVARPDLPPVMLGAGGVHHVAFRTPNDEEHAAWRERLAKVGLGVTPIIDRYYFKSVYFREPGGVLFEIATDGPGFATDEDAERLGEKLALPPFLEGDREKIERGLKPLDN